MTRRVMIGGLLAAGIVGWGAARAPRAQAQTADDVVARHLTATGGADALGKLTSRRSTGTVSLSTADGEVSGSIELLAKVPNKTRVSITLDLSAMGAGSMEILQRFDGTSGSLSNSMQGDVQITGSQLENMRNNLFPTALLHYKENGTTIALLPKDSLDGRDVLVVQATPKSGPAIKMFFDADTYLLVRSIVHVSAAQLGGDEIDQVSDFSDYRDVAGVKVPFQVVNSGGPQTLTIKLTKVEHNVPIDDSAFAG